MRTSHFISQQFHYFCQGVYYWGLTEVLGLKTRFYIVTANPDHLTVGLDALYTLYIGYIERSRLNSFPAVIATLFCSEVFYNSKGAL